MREDGVFFQRASIPGLRVYEEQEERVSEWRFLEVLRLVLFSYFRSRCHRPDFVQVAEKSQHHLLFPPISNTPHPHTRSTHLLTDS